MSEGLLQEVLEEEDTQKDRYLTFALSEEYYGIEIRHVTEIIGLQPITKVPELPEYICGIINLRGKIIPVMDVRIRFKKPYREYNDRTCVIVIELMNTSIGLIVDSVEEVLTIPETEVVVPSGTNIMNNRYIKGIGKVGDEVKLIMDCDKLLNTDELDKIK
jgi:purine-binding chemotaxis protein CheW